MDLLRWDFWISLEEEQETEESGTAMVIPPLLPLKLTNPLPLPILAASALIALLHSPFYFYLHSSHNV